MASEPYFTEQEPETREVAFVCQFISGKNVDLNLECFERLCSFAIVVAHYMQEFFNISF